MTLDVRIMIIIKTLRFHEE